MLTEILVAVLTIAVLYWFCVNPSLYWTNRGVKQKFQVPLLGENWRTFLRLECFADMVVRIYQQFPNKRYCGIYQCSTPILLIRDPELIKQITVKDFDHFTDHRSLVPENIDPIWAKNLFALNGQKWRDMRPVLSPSFTSKKMRNMFGLMSDCAQNFTRHFLEKKEALVEIELKDSFSRYASDIIATTAFGIKIDSINDPENEFYLTGLQTPFNGLRFLISFFLPTFLLRLFNFSLVSNKARTFFLSLVEDSIKIREEQNIVRPDMLHLLMQAKKGKLKYEEDKEMFDGVAAAKESDIGKQIRTKIELTNMDIAAQAFVFFLGGFETSTSLMCFLGYELAANQDVQARLRQEVQATLEECDGAVTYDALLKMKYFDMVLTETLRKWPAGIIADRVCTKPYTIYPKLPAESPVHLHRGDVLWFPITGLHKDPHYYPHPERFDPGRFADGAGVAFLPFGSGPRNCIGSRFALLEVKTVFFHLLARFEVVPVGRSQVPVRLSKSNVALLAEGGMWFGLRKIGGS